MSELPTVRRIEKAPNATGIDVVFLCPACQFAHGVSTREPGPVWKFNGDMVKPTFDPSIRVERPDQWCEQQQKFLVTHTCHSTITDGVISFCPDCTHELKNQSVPLPTFE